MKLENLGVIFNTFVYVGIFLFTQARIYTFCNLSETFEKFRSSSETHRNSSEIMDVTETQLKHQKVK